MGIILKISPKLQAKIDVCMAHCPNTEWYGVLFYKELTPLKEFKLSNSATAQAGSYPVFEAIDMYPIAGGTETYTCGEPSVDTATYAKEHKLLRCHKGMIHSHNKIHAFFSSIDEKTLLTEAKDTDYPFYLSLVVSSTSDYVAKLIWKMNETQDITSKFVAKLPCNKEVFIGERTQNKNINALSTFEVIIERPSEYDIDRATAYEYLMEISERIMPTVLKQSPICTEPSTLKVTEKKEEKPAEEEEVKEEVVQEATLFIYRMLTGLVSIGDFNAPLFGSNWQIIIEDTAAFYSSSDTTKNLIEEYWNMLCSNATWDVLDYAVIVIGDVAKGIKNKKTTIFIDKAEEYLNEYVDDTTD